MKKIERYQPARVCLGDESLIAPHGRVGTGSPSGSPLALIGKEDMKILGVTLIALNLAMAAWNALLVVYGDGGVWNVIAGAFAFVVAAALYWEYGEGMMG